MIQKYLVSALFIFPITVLAEKHSTDIECVFSDSNLIVKIEDFDGTGYIKQPKVFNVSFTNRDNNKTYVGKTVGPISSGAASFISRYKQAFNFKLKTDDGERVLALFICESSELNNYPAAYGAVPEKGLVGKSYVTGVCSANDLHEVAGYWCL